MAWIKVIDEKDATGKLKEVYERIGEERGEVANIYKINSLNPQSMEDHLNFYMNLVYGHLDLTREQRELIAVAVSVTNGCQYCINHHAEALNAYWKDREKLNKFIDNFNFVELPEKDRTMIEYAIKLTKALKSISDKDIEKLQEQNFSDADILNINLVTAYFNFVNRVALGLGVEFSSDEITGYKY
jgi:uncharacterized peroxidase-related enzyme